MRDPIELVGGDPKPGRKAPIAFLGLALITSMAFVFLLSGLPREQRRMAQWVDHTLEVLNMAANLDADLATAISEARGFVLDQQSNTDASFEAAAFRVSGDLANLWRLTADNPVQQSALNRLEPLVGARIHVLHNIITTVGPGGQLGDPRFGMQQLAGNAMMVEINQITGDFRDQERYLLAARRAAARWLMKIWFSVSLCCGILAAASGFSAVALLVGRNRRTEHLAELRDLNAGLEERVEARNTDLAVSEAGFRRLANDLLASETRYRMLAENTNDLIICTGLDLRRTYVSPACRMVFGYEPEQMLRDEATAVVHPGDAELVYAALYPLTVATSEQALVTYRARHKDGRWIWVEANISLVRDQNSSLPASLVASLRDISERHAHADQLHSSNARLERLARHLVSARDTAKRASRAKSRFLAGMSHELRTPLNGILGYAQLLRMEGGLTSAQTVRIDAMLDAGKHLLEMIHCILDLSEIEIEGFALQPVDFDLHRLVGACLDLVRLAAEAKSLVLHISIAPDVPLHVTADPTRVRQVLLNLLGNAVKFTPKGRVLLDLFTTGNGGRLRFQVTDTGPGIPPEQRRRLFQEFERLDAEATRTDEGAGLGLSISAQLALLMGGRVGYDDNPSGGSVFWLELPLVASAAAPPELPAVRAEDANVVSPPPQPAPRVLTVLVVDDIAMNREIASSFLSAAGHQVICVDGGAVAVAEVATRDYDVILMDIRMPEMDGLEATRRIRAIQGRRGRVPIIALTAQAFADQVAECRDAGMDSHLAKPFDPDALLAAVLQITAADRVSFAVASSKPGTRFLTVTETGSDLPVFDLTAFERTAAFLSPGSVAAYLRDISERGDALFRELGEPDSINDTGTSLAEAAHALAGSAGMFGFERLASVGRHFERAVQTGAADTPALAASLGNTLEATLQVIRERAPAGVEA